jgi:hypothetical protein
VSELRRRHNSAPAKFTLHLCQVPAGDARVTGGSKRSTQFMG